MKEEEDIHGKDNHLELQNNMILEKVAGRPTTTSGRLSAVVSVSFHCYKSVSSHEE